MKICAQDLDTEEAGFRHTALDQIRHLGPDSEHKVITLVLGLQLIQEVGIARAVPKVAISVSSCWLPPARGLLLVPCCPEISPPGRPLCTGVNMAGGPVLLPGEDS